MEGENINQRIAAIIEDKKINPNSFAIKLGVKAAIIYNILKERNKPGYDLLLKICETYNINGNWLITGTGNMYLGNNTFDGADTTNVGSDLNIKLTKLAASSLLYLEFHLSDIHLNLKLLQENLTKESFDRKEYEETHKNIIAIFKVLKANLKSQELDNKSLVDGLLKFDEGIRFYLDNIRDLSKELHLHNS